MHCLSYCTWRNFKKHQQLWKLMRKMRKVLVKWKQIAGKLSTKNNYCKWGFFLCKFTVCYIICNYSFWKREISETMQQTKTRQLCKDLFCCHFTENSPEMKLYATGFAKTKVLIYYSIENSFHLTPPRQCLVLSSIGQNCDM